MHGELFDSRKVKSGLCSRQVGFPKRDLAKLKVALDNTHAIVWIRSTKQSRWAKLGQLLGFARATSDKALSATVWDVAVSHHCCYSPRLHTVQHILQ